MNQRGEIEKQAEFARERARTTEEGDTNFLNMIMEGSKLRPPNIMSKSSS